VLDLGLKTSMLLGTALATALFHTLIPDHWLPFVLIGRARSWSVPTTAMISGLSAVIHAALSVLLGLLAMAIGLAWAQSVGESLATASAVMLIAFGIGYALWAWRKGGHFHPGGRLLHDHDNTRGCAGEEGAHPQHLHYHADEELIHGTDRRGGLYLAVIIGLNPCVLILPVLLSSAERGLGAVAQVTFVYVVTTSVLMVGLSVLGVAGTRRMPVPGIARYMEAGSGLLIALTGAVLLWLE
jgi:ABC-type nickel/cobalt efflux system permease component RcnA